MRFLTTYIAARRTATYNPKTDVEKNLAKYPKADAWLPLKANAVDMVVLVNKESASIIKIVNLRPWK